eukprot:CAMPEP_0180286800 /NCGR_PEP_ID=MMETSP0988-20121125/12879_1 /TAXON_ID=697907 /ORGANISM="non described non described, Strain CCMP2293" /LENGTH=33 /DNA_ID= /DNA_START= /DNA_END= /DNA_ORIENTATION=
MPVPVPKDWDTKGPPRDAIPQVARRANLTTKRS